MTKKDKNISEKLHLESQLNIITKNKQTINKGHDAITLIRCTKRKEYKRDREFSRKIAQTFTLKDMFNVLRSEEITIFWMVNRRGVLLHIYSKPRDMIYIINPIRSITRTIKHCKVNMMADNWRLIAYHINQGVVNASLLVKMDSTNLGEETNISSNLEY